jgi:hypothetical protein
MTISRLFMSLLLGLRVDHDTQCRLANRPLCLRRNRTVHQHRPLRRVPGRALPRGAGRARGRVLHAGRVERRAPAAFVVLGQLEVEALAVHPDGDVPDAGPGVEPGAQGVERSIVRRHGAPGEADRSTKELAALVEHLIR